MKLESQWIVGFVDGQGRFHVGINPHEEMESGYQVLPEFTVAQHKKDVKILYALKDYFGCGMVRTSQEDRMVYRVRGKDHLLDAIIPFFMKHPLKTQKNIDFRKFRRVLLEMERGNHLTKEGVEEIQRIISEVIKGRSR